MIKPTASAIRKKRAALIKKTAALAEAVESLKQECSHPTPHIKYRGSSGNYDNADSYWIEWHCTDCGKYWTTPQGSVYEDEYPNAIQVMTKL